MMPSSSSCPSGAAKAYSSLNAATTGTGVVAAAKIAGWCVESARLIGMGVFGSRRVFIAVLVCCSFVEAAAQEPASLADDLEYKIEIGRHEQLIKIQRSKVAADEVHTSSPDRPQSRRLVAARSQVGQTCTQGRSPRCDNGRRVATTAIRSTDRIAMEGEKAIFSIEPLRP